MYMSGHPASEKTLVAIDNKTETGNASLDSINTRMLNSNISLEQIGQNTTSTVNSLDTINGNVIAGNNNTNSIDGRLNTANQKLTTINTNTGLTATVALQSDNKLEDIKLQLSDMELKMAETNNKLDTLVNLAEIEESLLTTYYIPTVGNTGIFIPNSDGAKIKSINYANDNGNHGCVAFYDLDSTATPPDHTTDYKFALFSNNRSVQFKSYEGYIYFENGIWARTVLNANPKHNAAGQTPNGLTVTYYK